MAKSQPNLSHAQSQDSVEYRDIDGFPGYRVGSDGSVWSCRLVGGGRKGLGSQWRQMRLCAGNNSYRVAGLCRDGRKVTRYVHDLVLCAFVGPRPSGSQACHAPDRSPLNNAVSNLRWDTPSANNGDKKAQGTQQVGEQNPRAKLTAAQVQAIRRRVACGEKTIAIAKEIGVTNTLVRLIVQRKCWKHVA